MLDAQASRQVKEAGMRLALDYSADWKDRVLLELRGWLAIHKARGNDSMTIEQFRSETACQPSSAKAWGSLPRIACAAGLIAPARRADGSLIKRPAASLRTHGHDVGVYLILLPYFSAPATAEPSPTSHHDGAAVAARQPPGVSRVGDPGSSIADACAQYHAGRGPMDQAMGEGG